MRVLFSAVPAHGHLLPLVSLMEAALDEGHGAAVVTSAGVGEVVGQELPPGIEHLAAGPLPLEFSLEAARRTGADLTVPLSADTVGEIFGGARLDATAEPALRLAREWRPDVVVADKYDTVGPLIAAALGVPWHAVGISVGTPPSWAMAIERAARARYASRGLEPVDATSYLDLWPALLRDPDGPAPTVPVHALRPRAHHRGGANAWDRPTFTDPSKPTVLVALGTVFSDTASLAAVVDAVARPEINVLASLGLSLDGEPVRAEESADRLGEVRHVPFAPMELLLDGARAVVGTAGAGTVLEALSHRVPLVLWPRGGEGPAIAERMRRAGVAVVVTDAAEIGTAVTTVLDDPSYRDAAAAIAAQIAEAPQAREVLRTVVTASVPLVRP